MKWEALYLLIVGCVMWFMAIRLTAKQIGFLFDSRSASGRFVRWKEQTSLRGHTYYYPIVAYSVAGKEYEITGNTGNSAKSAAEVGDFHRVRYRKDAPHDGQIFSFFHFCLAPLGFAILAAGATAALLDVQGIIDL